MEILDKAKKKLLKIVDVFGQDYPANAEVLYCLLIGETGAGKSSLIDLFAFWSINNFTQTPDFKNAKSIIQGDRGGSQTESQTKKPVCYRFHLRHNDKSYILHFIDTPGMGDVSGLKNDDDNIQLILQFVSAFPQLNAIGLLLNGSNCRLSARTKYVLQRIYGLCPQTFQERLYLIFTNVQLMPNFDLKSIEVPILENNVLSLDNLLFSKGVKEKHFNTMTQFQKQKIHSNYNECKDALFYLFDSISRCCGINTKEFVSLKQSRDTMRLQIKNILSKISALNQFLTIMQQQEDEIHTHKLSLEELKAKAKATKEVLREHVEETNYHNTICLGSGPKCGKGQPCHKMCHLSFTQTTGHNIFTGCACMQDNTCLECGCSYTQHVHSKRYVWYEKELVSLLSDEEKKQLEEMTSAEKAKLMMLQKYKQEKEILKDGLAHSVSALKSALQELKLLCPYFDYKLELLFAIEMLRESVLTAKNEMERRSNRETQDYFIRMIKEYDMAQQIDENAIDEEVSDLD